jgi:type IV secretory pathway TrbF-like protein
MRKEKAKRVIDMHDTVRAFLNEVPFHQAENETVQVDVRSFILRNPLDLEITVSVLRRIESQIIRITYLGRYIL